MGSKALVNGAWALEEQMASIDGIRLRSWFLAIIGSNSVPLRDRWQNALYSNAQNYEVCDVC